MSLEIERLALLSQDRYNELLSEFVATYSLLGESDITSIWFVGGGALSKYVKIDHSHTDKTAKLVYKHKDGAKRDEYKVGVKPAELKDLDKILQAALGDVSRYETSQQRHDFDTDEGLVISLKYTTDMKWHIEIESRGLDGAQQAEEDIGNFAKMYDLHVLSDAEEARLYSEILQKRSVMNSGS